MTLIDFLLQYLALVLASITASVILAFLGFFTIKHMIDKAMQSKEVRAFRKTIDAVKVQIEKLKKEGEKIAKQIEKMLPKEVEYIE